MTSQLDRIEMMLMNLNTRKKDGDGADIFLIPDQGRRVVIKALRAWKTSTDCSEIEAQWAGKLIRDLGGKP